MSEADELYNKLTDYEIAAYSSVEPAEEPHIIVGPNGGKDRVIQVPEALKRLGNQYDHDVETVTIECPRYWDGMDMKDMTPYINIMRPDGTKISLLGENKQYYEPVADTGEDVPTEGLVYIDNGDGTLDVAICYSVSGDNIVIPGTIVNQEVLISNSGYDDDVTKKFIEYAVVRRLQSDVVDATETLTVYVDMDGYLFEPYVNRSQDVKTIYIKGTSLPVMGGTYSPENTFNAYSNLTDIYVHWSEGTVPGAPWGATNATVHYNAFAEDEGARTDVPKDKILFDWPIKENITSHAGKLKFIIQLRQTNDEGVVINHWNSDLCTDCYISEGMEWEDYTESSESYDAITQALTIMEDAIEAAEEAKVTKDEIATIKDEAIAAKEQVEAVVSNLDDSVTDPVGRKYYVSGENKGEIYNDYDNNTAAGDKASAFGTHTKASGDNQIVAGKYNIEDTENKYAAIIGNGESETSPSNAVTVDWDGNVEVAGDVTIGETNIGGELLKSGVILADSIHSYGSLGADGAAHLKGGVISEEGGIDVKGNISTQGNVSGKKLILTDMSSKTGQMVFVGNGGELTPSSKLPSDLTAKGTFNVEGNLNVGGNLKFENYTPFSDAEGGRLVNVTTGGKLRAVDPNNYDEIVDIGNKAFKPWLRTRFRRPNWGGNHNPIGFYHFSMSLSNSKKDQTDNNNMVLVTRGSDKFQSAAIAAGLYYGFVRLDPFVGSAPDWFYNKYYGRPVSIGLIYVPPYNDLFDNDIFNSIRVSLPLDEYSYVVGTNPQSAKFGDLIFLPNTGSLVNNDGYGPGYHTYDVYYNEQDAVDKPAYLDLYFYPIFKEYIFND